MKLNKKNDIISQTITLLALSCCMLSCANESSKFGKDSVNKEESVASYEVNMNNIKENALFYDNLAFLSDEYNHVFQIENGQIAEHFQYPLIDLKEENYDKVIGMNIFQAVEYIGCPTFLGNVSDSSLDYSCYDGYMRRVYLDKEDNQYVITKVEKINKDTKFYQSFFDRNAENPSIEDVKKLKVGMCIDEVIKTLKNKLNFTYNSNHSFGKPIVVMTKEGIQVNLIIEGADIMDCEHMHFNPNVRFTDYFYLFGCYSENHDILISDQPKDCTPYFDKDDTRFSSQEVTVSYLKENNCFFFKDYVFASDSKNHVFKIKDDKIISHDTFDKISYPRNPNNLFKNLDGIEFSHTFKELGIPLFMNDSKNPNRVDYILQNGYMMTAEIIEKDGELTYHFLSGNNATWAFTDYWKNERDDFVNKEKANLIKKDMCVASVTSLIGKPTQIFYNDDAKMSYKFVYNMENEEKLEIVFAIKRIEKCCEHAYKYEDIGFDINDNMISGIVYNNLLYLYVNSISVAK